MDGFERVLRRYGRPAKVWSGGTVRTGPAMIQPILEKKEQWSATPLGRQRRDRFLYLGAPDVPLGGPGEHLEWEGQSYDIVTAQAVKLGARTLYWWAVLTVREDET